MLARPSRRPLIAGAIVLIAGAAAVPALTMAQPSSTALVLQEPPPQVVLQDVPPDKGPNELFGQGDRIVISSPVETKDHERLGSFAGECTGIGQAQPLGRATLLCRVTYALRRGQIVAEGIYRLDGTGRMPIVGGSGAYAGVHGTLSQAKPAKGFDSADRLTFRR